MSDERKAGLAALALLVTLAGCSDGSSSGGDGATGSGGAAGQGSGGSAGGGAGAGAGSNAGGSGACVTPALEPGDHVRQLEHDGVMREYTVHVPPGHGAEPQDLVLNFHGLTSNMDEQAAFSAMTPKADAEGFVLVYPNGIDNAFNAGACCAFGDTDRDDVGFARAIVQEVSSLLCINPERVFSTGMSNGGYMSYLLACEAADVFRAIAPVAGYLGLPPEDCNPSRKVPLIHFHGTEDGLVSYPNGGIGAGLGSVPSLVAWWAERNGCDPEPKVTLQQGTGTCQTWSGCEDNADVVLCTLEGMDHCWPGQSVCPFGSSTTDIVANDAMWDFFQAH